MLSLLYVTVKNRRKTWHVNLDKNWLMQINRGDTQWNMWRSTGFWDRIR